MNARIFFWAAGIVLALDILQGVQAQSADGQTPAWFAKTLEPIENKIPVVPLWMVLAGVGAMANFA